MTNDQVAAVFNRIADLLEIKGETRFRVNAYRDVARTIGDLGEDLNAVAREGRLREIKGVGEAISAKILEMLQTGRLAYDEALRQEVPESLIALREVPGLGPRKIKMLFDDLGVQSVADLQREIQTGRVAKLPGMGEKTVQNLARELDRWQERGKRTPLGIAWPLADAVAAELLAASPAVLRIIPAGSIRRRRDTIGDIDLLASSADPAAVLDAFVGLPLIKETIGRGDTKASILTENDRQIDLRVVGPSSWGAALQYFTGSKAHNVRIRENCVRRGWRLNEYGLIDEPSGRVIASADEDEIYQALGMDPIPPELREDSGEIEAALAHKLPRLITAGDIRGDLHSHSDWSDGGATIEVMAEAARARGYEYLALTDHSQSLGIAHGLTVERVREQRAIVDDLNQRLGGFRLLHGIELEIRADATLDFPDDVLAQFDLVIASVHSSQHQPREKIMARLLTAARNPHVDIIGHPSGRLLGQREPYDVDLDELIRVCAETGTALELNANPSRLDLDDIHARHARDRGVLLAIDTDAHAPDNFDLLRFGIATARRAWIEPEHVLNTRPLLELLVWLKRNE